jgi:hypothetical protein
MNFTSIRLITADFEPLVRFYEQLFGQPLTRLAPVFAELRTAGATPAPWPPSAARKWPQPPPTARLSSSFEWPT